MMEAIANLVRAFPADRARHGQPYVAFELDHGPGPSGELEWSLAVRCAPAARRRPRRRAQRRLPRRPPRPHRAASRPQPRADAPRRPRARACASASSAASSTRCWPPATSSPRRRWRRSRTPRSSLGVPSIDPLHAHARAGLLRGARAPAATAATRTGSSRQERWGLPEGGLTSTLNRAEMTNAEPHPEPQPVLARARRRRRRPRDAAASSPPPSRPAAARTACTAAGCSSARTSTAAASPTRHAAARCPPRAR